MPIYRGFPGSGGKTPARRSRYQKEATPATAAPTTSSVEPKDKTAQLGKERETNLRAGYDQLCQSYRAIDDFRAKLLGFLPVVTGGGLLLLSRNVDGLAAEIFLPVGLSASSLF
jgi:hypothetical protein